MLDYNLWRLALLFNIFINFFTVLSIYLLFRILSAKWYHYLIFAPVLFFILPLTDHILTILPITIFIYFILISKGGIDRLPSVGLLFVGLLLAVVSLIKFDIFLASIYVIAISIALFIINRDIKSALCLFSSYVLSIIALWIFAGQNLANIPGYIYSSIDISKGYSGAMAIDGPFWQVQLGLISVLVVVFFLIYSYKSNEKSLMIFLTMNLVILFSTFKLGFVRQDEHFIYFLKAYLLIFGLILIFMLMKLEEIKRIEIKHIYSSC